MKPIVTILKKDLEKCHEILAPLTELCDQVEPHTDSYDFHPKQKATMSFICLLLDQEVMYKLTFQDSLAKKV